MPTTIFSLPIRVYIEDTDAGGIVYHANYLKYMERARTEWLRSTGYGRQQLKTIGIMFVVSGMNIRYLAPAKLDDQLVATASLIKLKRASLVLRQEVYLLKDSPSQSIDQPVNQHITEPSRTKLCTAEVNIVSVDRLSFKPCAFDPIKEALMNLHAN